MFLGLLELKETGRFCRFEKCFAVFLCPKTNDDGALKEPGPGSGPLPDSGTLCFARAVKTSLPLSLQQ